MKPRHPFDANAAVVLRLRCQSPSETARAVGCSDDDDERARGRIQRRTGVADPEGEGAVRGARYLRATLAHRERAPHQAIQDAMSTQISVVDDKYDDLPVRVSQLEARVFPPERR